VVKIHDLASKWRQNLMSIMNSYSVEEYARRWKKSEGKEFGTLNGSKVFGNY
jgi:hypothetical protein